VRPSRRNVRELSEEIDSGRHNTEGVRGGGKHNARGAEGEDGSGEKFALVDALSAKHYESSHLPGAGNLPYEFVDAAETVRPDKDAEISLFRIQNELT
jgi:hypothetical protein